MDTAGCRYEMPRLGSPDAIVYSWSTPILQSCIHMEGRGLCSFEPVWPSGKALG